MKAPRRFKLPPQIMEVLSKKLIEGFLCEEDFLAVIEKSGITHQIADLYRQQWNKTRPKRLSGKIRR
jgi:hypothetical protein